MTTGETDRKLYKKSNKIHSKFDIIRVSKEGCVFCMREKAKQLRNEYYMISLESEISPEDEVRVVDKIIDCIDLKKIGYVAKERKSNAGCPKYGDKDMLKILVYGYRKGLHSGRKLEEACKNDLRFRWLVGGLTPDANTINDYRKEHIEEIKNCFYEVNRMYIEMGILKIRNYSQDGFKIKAVNSKERNYTKNKIMDRIAREKKAIAEQEEIQMTLESEQRKVEEYLSHMEIEENKEQVKKELEEVEAKLAEAKEELKEIEGRKQRHEELLKKMVEKKTNQISLTDPESKLMKNNGKFEVCYNNQTAVDVESHLTIAMNTDDNPADVGSMSSLGEIIKREYGEENVITNVTDKGYDSKVDMVSCIEGGVIPQVTPKDKGTKKIELETIYEEAEVTEEELKSSKGRDIKKCLRSGKIPECYEEVIENIRIEEIEKKISETKEKQLEEKKETSDEVKERAMREQIFIKDENTGAVLCPMGEHLNPKSKRAEGKVRFANKLACKNCKNPCTKSKYKEIEMRENQKELHPRNNTQEKAREVISKPRNKSKKVKLKVVKFELKIDEGLLKKRMATSEHSQGTMKNVDNYSSYHMKGKQKVSGEVALHFLASNIRRVYNMYSYKELMEKMNTLEEKKITMLEKELKTVKNSLKNVFLKKYRLIN